ncbi:uncharacterized protein CTRU02_212910 [Colletotrichum truncatum]|uniref:Uncharacterized protein n=1 Tax=Colletotrichum truncatum TaxID=5467 RepID=A0ACC3YJF2_COLTU|nr:uncharacterized protein CTRU02_03232 [Colletotrichum truncatum]KAF6797201.1 hypothetical protein CTRU02_03232 [Colletotrichum truncatum]
MDRNPTSSEQPPPRYSASKPADLSRQPLRYSPRPVYILAIYLILLLVPWICVVVVNQRTTSDPWGILMQDDMDRYRRWLRVASFLSAVTAVAALPCVAALLAHGAVVYSQRRFHEQSLSLRQLLALSDGRWTAAVSIRETSSYLLLAAGLLLLAGVQYPLQSVLMPMSSRVVYPCESSRHLTKWDRTCDGAGYRAERLGKEPEPTLLREPNDVPHVIDVVRSRMTNITSADIQDNLWRGNNTHRSFLVGVDQKYDDSFWVSALSAGITTGPLRQHSMRLNSTADCQVTNRDEFPSHCDGYATSIEGFGVMIRTCLPDKFNNVAIERSPLPARRRQDIEEVLFIDAQISPEAAQAPDFLLDAAENVTIQCVSKTTRAFFELGNFHNELHPSEIVEEWPSDDEMRARFHDYDWSGNLITRNWEEGWDRDRYAGWTSLRGPLRTTTEALFGAGSYPQAVLDFLSQTFPDNQIPDNTSDTAIHEAQRRVCALSSPLHDWQLPHNSHNDEFDSWYPSIYNGCTLKKLPKSLFRMAQGLRHLTVAQSTLGVGMYLSNAAVLQDAATNDAARTIYNLTGTDFVAPQHSLGATITLSTLISIQVVCLILLVGYIYSVPTWTNTLDAFAMMRIGAQLRSTVNLLPLRRATQDDMDRFSEMEGLIGVVPGPGTTVDDDLELATITSTRSFRNMPSSHHYELVRPASPANSILSLDMPAAPPQTRQPSQATTAGMTPDDLSSYLQGGGLASPSVLSVASSVRSASPPPPYLPASSSTREQRPRLPYELGLGAPGLVSKALWKKHQPK